MLDHFFSKYALYFTTQVCDYHLLFWLTGTNWPSQSFEQSPAVLRREFAAGSSDWRTFGNTETGEPVSLQIFEIIFNFKESSWNSKMLEVDFDHICWPTENIVIIRSPPLLTCASHYISKSIWHLKPLTFKMEDHELL